ncbi:spike base protein, RCAP_Rcc01079 family [Mangrovicoccus ximenensis]|uniref:spike base protein, RCAP_Rcc01079 family n=1 Tax=Mangrovicoccus ximenensis TaxID=1911570 RepID=UPI000D39DAA7|nr:hypothetical protein [Mangrovicoccus ximenensis]
MIDFFKKFAKSLSGPITNAEPVTPSDVTDLPVIPRALYVGTGGDVTVELLDSPSGTARTFRNIPDASLLPVRVRKILATGTNAADILAVW